MTRTEACLALNLVPHLGPVRLRKLLEVFETPERVLGARVHQLRPIEGIGETIAEQLAHWQDHVDLPAELELIRQFGAGVLTPWDSLYPRALREIYNPPVVLYVWGAIEERDQRAISVVGSRKSSHYGLACAKRLSYQLAFTGLCVVSGLARGIDTAAHQGALAANGRTIAVLGSGLMDLYPEENFALAEKIAAHGAILSEYPMLCPPSAANFPYRNRIVAGWSQGLLVVEAGVKSGALITANQAIEHGRLVYAVPGPIDRPTSAGTNRLIQQGAKLVSSANDILDDLQCLFPPTPANTLPATLSADEQSVLSCLSSSESNLDALVGQTHLPAQKIASVLLHLELKHLAKQLPGQQFVRVYPAG